MSPPAAKSETRSSSGDSNEIKKRKMNNEAGAPATKLPPKSANLYSEITKMEERQSDARTAEQDSKIFAETCNEMKVLLDQMLEVKLAYKMMTKNSGASPAKESATKVHQDLTELRTKFSLMFLTLKKLNRLDKIRTKKIRESTNASKHRVDAFHLQLQNLRYEVMHLHKEVAKCLQFRSRDQDMDLVTIEEFYEKAPSEVSRKDQTETNEHEQRLARLEYENLQRKQMSEEYNRLEKEKQQFEAQILERKTKLSNLKPQLAAILEKSKPVQDYLEMPLNEERDQLNLAKYLPAPLFVLFTEMRAYGAACDRMIHVTVKGDVEEAKSANAARRKQAHFDKTEIDDEENLEEAVDDDDQDIDARNQKGKKSREVETNGNGTSGDMDVQALEARASGINSGSTSKNIDSKSQKIAKMFSVHPLIVEAQIDIRDEKDNECNKINLIFSHLSKLDIVTVKITLDLNKETKNLGAADREVLNNSSIFSHLLSGCDMGNTSPNPNTIYQLTNLIPDGKIPLLQLQEIGSTYNWVQKLGGMNFPEHQDSSLDISDEEDSSDEEKPASKNMYGRSLCQTHMESIIIGLKQRFLSRLALARQLSVLEKAKLTSVPDLPIPQQFQKDFPTPKTQCRIRAWYAVEWEQYSGLEVTRHLVETRAVTSNDFFFRLQINREPATLIALVAIGPHYPYSSPVFCLNLHWNGEHNIHNSENMRALEREVNTCYSNLLNISDAKKKRRSKKFIQESKERNELLSLQITRLMTCTDVLLESWNTVQPNLNHGGLFGKGSGVDFPREKLFLQPVRGRNRAPPLKYQSQLQLFTQ